MLNDVNANNERVQNQVKELSAQIATLRAENARLTSAGGAVASLRKDLEETNARLAEARKATEQHGASVAELTGLNEKLSGEKSALEMQLGQSRQAADAARAELSDVRGKIAQGDRALQAQLAMLNEVNANNERVQTQVKELTAQVATLRAENTRLASAGEATATVRTELDDVKARLTESRKAAEQHGATVAELTAANEKLGADVKTLQGQLEGLRGENTRLAQSDAALRDAEQRAANLGAAATQLASAQRDLQTARGEIARLTNTVQALDRDRTARVTALQQENAAIAARLRQAQGTLDSIASAARLINGGTGAPTAPVANAPAASTAAANVGIAPAPRLHTVVEGDSLTRISVRYYGTGNRWQDIYEANRETLKGENALRPGQRLRIP
jgi:nucleoid-associated protein YgaU